MRRIIAFNRISADGYFAGNDGDLNWSVPEPEIDKGAVASMAGQGSMLFGRKTYEMFESFWPGVAKQTDSAPDPHVPGRASKEMLAMAKWIDQGEKLVFSRSRKNASWNNTRLLGEFSPAKVEAFKAEAGADIMLFGSGSITSLLTQHKLIDEYQLVINPVFLGAGRTLLTGLSEYVRVQLVETRVYPSGNLLLKYHKN